MKPKELEATLWMLGILTFAALVATIGAILTK